MQVMPLLSEYNAKGSEKCTRGQRLETRGQLLFWETNIPMWKRDEKKLEKQINK